MTKEKVSAKVRHDRIAARKRARPNKKRERKYQRSTYDTIPGATLRRQWVSPFPTLDKPKEKKINEISLD